MAALGAAIEYRASFIRTSKLCFSPGGLSIWTVGTFHFRDGSMADVLLGDNLCFGAELGSQSRREVWWLWYMFVSEHCIYEVRLVSSDKRLLRAAIRDILVATLPHSSHVISVAADAASRWPQSSQNWTTMMLSSRRTNKMEKEMSGGVSGASQNVRYPRSNWHR